MQLCIVGVDHVLSLVNQIDSVNAESSCGLYIYEGAYMRPE
jgi:hypothetical protein